MSKASYTAVVLDQPSQAALRAAFPCPQDSRPVYHHMTINMGPISDGPAVGRLGETVTLKVVSFAADHRVQAVGVETDVPSVNARKHITLNVSPAGKPKHSNDLHTWNDVEPFELTGKIEEC